MSIAFSQRHILAGIALTLVAGAIWGMFLKDYMSVGTDEDPQWPASREEADSNATEFEYFSRRGLVPADNSRAIAEQNMFSPTRKEWAPAQPKVEAVPPEARSGAAVKSRPDIELRGISFVGGKSWAILRFLSFKPEETQVLREGEYVSVPEGAGNGYLLVAKVGKESVVIKDQDGVEYTIGLHDHQRETVPSPPVEPRVVVDSAVAKPESKKVVPPAKVPVKPPVPGQAKKVVPKKVVPKNTQ